MWSEAARLSVSILSEEGTLLMMSLDHCSQIRQSRLAKQQIDLTSVNACAAIPLDLSSTRTTSRASVCVVPSQIFSTILS